MKNFDTADLNHWFTHHPPAGDQVARYQELRQKAREFAQCVDDLCGVTLESGQAMLLLRQAVMMANASIACNGTGAE